MRKGCDKMQMRFVTAFLRRYYISSVLPEIFRGRNRERKRSSRTGTSQARPHSCSGRLLRMSLAKTDPAVCCRISSREMKAAARAVQRMPGSESLANLLRMVMSTTVMATG